MNGAKNEQEFSNSLNVLAIDITRANIHWRIQNDLRMELVAHPVVLAQSETFWSLTLDAHTHVAVQCLSRAYDSHPRALHLCRWLEDIRNNLPLFQESYFRKRLAGNPFVDSLAADPRIPDLATLDSDIELCSPKNAEVVQLLRFRNNHGAHRNATISKAGANAPDKNALLDDVVDVLLKRAVTILNRYSDLFMATTHSMTILGHDDYQAVFRAVNEMVDREDQQLREEFIRAGHSPEEADRLVGPLFPRRKSP